jgi:Zn-dependent metalloprotease
VKILKTGLSLVLLGSGLAAVPGLTAAAVGQPAAPAVSAAAGDSLVQRMRDEASGSVRVSTDRATGKVGFVRASGQGDLLPSVQAGSPAAAAQKASAYLAEYGVAFGAARGELTQSGISSTTSGWTVDYVQRHRGVEVFGSKIRAHLDEQGDLTSVNGYAAPGLSLDVTPRLSADEASRRAVDIVRAKTGTPDGRVSTAGLKAAETELRIYRLGSTRGVSGKAVLAWVVEVTNRSSVRDMVFLDADSGKILNRYSMMAHALDRELYEASINDNGTPDDESDDFVDYDLVWSEGDPFPGSLDVDQRNEVEGTGEAYWLFKNTFGRDSYDGAGAKMITVNNDPSINCPNANWNGETTNYCAGVSSDDTVAHEWGHAYTEYTSGLIYQWQSGAMNEGFSDIWGETVDQVNDRYNETPDGPRTVGQCSVYTRGAVGLTINTPPDIAGPCDAAPAAFGPVFNKTGVTTDVIVAQDDATDGSATNGCAAFDNAAAVDGNFAYVDRGACTFAIKAQNAQAAGAEGIIIGNNVDGEAPFSPSGDADIYGVMIRKEDGTRIKSASGPVNVTIKDIDEATKDDSYRWLSAEGDPAFGGAIRDMWNPTCYGDPGKVSDVEYKCSPDDSGGVHSNSGVVNHAYALLVDGGTYNGVNVPAIGMDKAANIFWRTQSEYLFPVADFADLADGLAASCTDLVGDPINKVTVEPNATPEAATPITPLDCASVASVSEAVELRLDPAQQCEFKPLLAKNAPGLCGKAFKTNVAWSEKFEDGLKGWTKTQDVVFEGASGLPWQSVAEAPGAHASKVVKGPDPADVGSCTGGAEDVSSRDSITSPAIKLPAGPSPRLSFQHYVATEYGYDGGNVKISVGGKPFAVIPTNAYVFNAPGATLEPAPGNTNPLAGQDGFTGTDGGENNGSWGTSIVDLKKAGAKAGQKIRIRFDMGRDGCGGLDGWYVDNVAVSTCKAKTATKATRAGNGKVAVEVSRAGSQGAAPTGIVKVFKGARLVGKGVVRKGSATVQVRGLAKGTHNLTVKYAGSAGFAASSDKVKVKVS